MDFIVTISKITSKFMGSLDNNNNNNNNNNSNSNYNNYNTKILYNPHICTFCRYLQMWVSHMINNTKLYLYCLQHQITLRGDKALISRCILPPPRREISYSPHNTHRALLTDLLQLTMQYVHEVLIRNVLYTIIIRKQRHGSQTMVVLP